MKGPSKKMNRRRLLLGVVATVSALLATACSSSTDSGGTSAATSAGTPSASSPAATSSAASSVASSAAGSSGGSSPAASSAAASDTASAGGSATGTSAATGDTATPDPTLLKGKTVWYADVTDANPLVQAIAQAINDRITAYGATMIRSFSMNNTTSQVDLGVQAEAMNRAITANPDAIAYFVLDPKSLKPQVTKARAAGIPVFAAFGKPDGFDVEAFITLNDEQQGYLSAKYLADHLPKGAKVALITGPPTPNVIAEMEGANKALQEAGVTIVGNEDQQRNLTDNSAGGQTIMQGILQSHPDVQGVFAYNDDTALGAIAAAKAANKTVLFASRNGSSDGVAAVKAGTLLVTCDIDPIALGHALGQAIVDQNSGKTTFAANTQLPSPDVSNCLITKDNADQWKPYDQIIKYQDIKTG
jgi:ribose transport system substrate-binding protein